MAVAAFCRGRSLRAGDMEEQLPTASSPLCDMSNRETTCPLGFLADVADGSAPCDAIAHSRDATDCSSASPLETGTSPHAIEAAATAKDAVGGQYGALCGESLESTTYQRCPSRQSSRASSPGLSSLSGSCRTGRTFVCRKCHREYASTDAVRKHARQNHPEWIRAQGQGDPSLYCAIIDAVASDAGPVRQVPTSCATPLTLPTAPAESEEPDEDPELLFTAAEKFIALSRLTEASTEAINSDDMLDPVGTRPAPRAGSKRPRSVRCGKCDGCEREDCGECKNCVDKPKFGGAGQRKQGCIKKVCHTPRPGV